MEKENDENGKPSIKRKTGFKEEMKELLVPIGVHEAKSAYYKLKLAKYLIVKSGYLLKKTAVSINEYHKEKKEKKERKACK